MFNLFKSYISFPEILYFKKISIHEHFRIGGNLKAFVWVMKFANIEKAVFLTNDWPPGNPRYKNNILELFKLKEIYNCLLYTSDAADE